VLVLVLNWNLLLDGKPSIPVSGIRNSQELVLKWIKMGQSREALKAKQAIRIKQYNCFFKLYCKERSDAVAIIF
jgi:hypothetical protein